jgi:hypothetical protein
VIKWPHLGWFPFFSEFLTLWKHKKEYRTKFRKWHHASGQHHYLWTGQHWMSVKHRGIPMPTWHGFSQWDLGIKSGRIMCMLQPKHVDVAYITQARAFTHDVSSTLKLPYAQVLKRSKWSTHNMTVKMSTNGYMAYTLMKIWLCTINALSSLMETRRRSNTLQPKQLMFTFFCLTQCLWFLEYMYMYIMMFTSCLPQHSQNPTGTNRSSGLIRNSYI